MSLSSSPCVDSHATDPPKHSPRGAPARGQKAMTRTSKRAGEETTAGARRHRHTLRSAAPRSRRASATHLGGARRVTTPAATPATQAEDGLRVSLLRNAALGRVAQPQARIRPARSEPLEDTGLS
jgi:hypothetical protein